MKGVCVLCIHIVMVMSSLPLPNMAQPTITNCSTNFYTMEQSLLSNTDNRYNLAVSYYPSRQAHPVIVRVDYTFKDSNETQRWFWSESEFYLIQPLEIFQFTSLLFSNSVYRRSEVTIQLDTNCSSAPKEYFILLTTRMKLYSQSPTTGPSSSTGRVSDEYIAVAASWEEISNDSLQSDFVKIWLHITLALFPIGSLLMLYLCDPIQLLLGDKTWTKLEDEHTHGSVAALIQISVLFTFFVFVLDIVGIYSTVTSEFLSFDSNSAFYLSTVTGLVVDVGTFCWVMFVMASSCYWDCANLFRGTKSCEQGSERVKKLMSTMMIAPIMSLSNHIHYIILAFFSDPFHAGSTSITYAVSFFLFYFIFRQFYNRLALHSNKRPKIVPYSKLCQKCSSNQPHSLHRVPSNASTAGLTKSSISGESNEDCSCFIPGPGCHAPFNTRVVVLSLFLIGPLIALYEGIIIVLFASLPITKSIEDAPTRLYSIYQGTGWIIVGLLTYSIVLHPSPFSVSKTFERLAKRLRLPERTNYWNKLSDEEKCAKVLSTLMEPYFERATGTHSSSGDITDGGDGGELEDLKDITLQVPDTIESRV